MIRGANDRRFSTHDTSGFYQIDSVDEFTTGIALITSSTVGRTVGTVALHETISEEFLAVFAVQLVHRGLGDVAVVVELLEDLLGDPVKDNAINQKRKV